MQGSYRLYQQFWTAPFVGTSIGVLSASGTSAVALVGAATAAAALASAGVGAATFTGAETAAAILASAGVGTATFVGTETAAGVLSSSGSGIATFVGVETAAAALSTSGSGVASFVGAETAAAVLSSSGVGAASFAGSGSNAGAIIAGGIGAANFVGAQTSAAVVSAAGTGALTAVGGIILSAVVSASGAGSASFAGSALVRAALSASGSGSFSGVMFNYGAVLAAITVNLQTVDTLERRGMNDFPMYAGDDKVLVITILDADKEPVDLTGCTIRWRASRSQSKAAVIIKKTSGAGVALSDPVNGQFTVTLVATDTESMTGTFYHEAELTFADGSKSTVLSGKMVILPSLIRATAS